MKLIKLLEDIEHEGLVVGDVLKVDTLSAASLVERKVAELVEEAEDEAAEVVETIDDIIDPELVKLRAAVMTSSVVGAADPGPVAVTRSPDDAPADAPVVPVSSPATTPTAPSPTSTAGSSGGTGATGASTTAASAANAAAARQATP
jgi:hypothetical protein